MVHSLNQKNLHINGLNILQSTKPRYWGIFELYSQNEDFPKKFDSANCLLLDQWNVMWNFRKIL